MRTLLLSLCALCFFHAHPVFGKDTQMTSPTPPSKKYTHEEAIFAMGCFWCGESEFRDKEGNPLPGIVSLRVGYAGGTKENPTYEDHEGYKEALKIVYDPTAVSYEKLLDIFWQNVDPLDGGGQFCDRGFAYTSVIFYTSDAQKTAAEKTKDQVQQILNSPVATTVTPHTSFYDAEEYHQDYKHKNPVRYKFYRWNCGRDQRLKEINLGALGEF